MITVTNRAADQIKKIVKNSGSQYIVDAINAPGLRYYLSVGVKAGGCSGFEYTLDVTENCPDDYIKNNSEGIDIICDPKSFPYLNGCQIDFVENMMKSGFVFLNPNAQHNCGCGKSFSVSCGECPENS